MKNTIERPATITEEQVRSGLERLYAMAMIPLREDFSSMPRQFSLGAYRVKWMERQGRFHISISGERVRWVYSEHCGAQAYEPATAALKYPRLDGHSRCVHSEYTTLDIEALYANAVRFFYPNALGAGNRPFMGITHDEAYCLINYRRVLAGQEPLGPEAVARLRSRPPREFLNLLDCMSQSDEWKPVSEVLDEVRQRFS